MARAARPPFPLLERVAAESGVPVPEQQAYLSIVRTAELLSGELAALFATRDLSGKQYNVLRALRRSGARGLTAGEVGAEMTDPRADVTRILDRLVARGLVERRADAQDRRVVRALLTEAGAALLAGLDAPLLALHRQQLGHLSPAEVETLLALLAKARGEAAEGEG